MSIQLSEQAAERIREIRNVQNVDPETPLRISVVSGGCSGLTYNLDFESGQPPADSDKTFEEYGVKIIVDMRSFLYVAGTRMVYSEELSGQGLHFINPNAESSCLCVLSFSL